MEAISEYPSNVVGTSLRRARPTRRLLAKVYCLVKKRAAANLVYPEIPYTEKYLAFHLSFAGATHDAERSRAQGSAWIIEELPALAIVGHRNAVIATHFGIPTFLPSNQKNPCERSLLDFAEWLSKVPGAHVFIAKAGDVTRADKPFCNREPVSYASRLDHEANWSSLPNPEDRPKAVAVFENYLKRMVNAGSLVRDRPYHHLQPTKARRGTVKNRQARSRLRG